MLRALKSRSLVLSLLFASIGGVATLYALAQADSNERPETERVLVASRTIAVGDQLGPDNVRIEELPKGGAPADAVRNADDVAHGYAALPMVKGEVVLRSKVSDAPPGSRLAAVIPEGKVAVSVAVSDVISTGGFIAPGDRVDVLGVVSKGADDAASLVLRDVAVLAVSNSIVGSPDTARDDRGGAGGKDNPRSLDTTVTLALTIDEARRLVQVDEVGKLRLALRSRAATGAVRQP